MSFKVRKKSKNRTLNVLIVPDNESPPKSFQVRYSTLIILIINFVILFIGIVWGVITYSSVYQSHLEKGELEKKNTALRKQLKKLEDVQLQLTELKAYNEKVRDSFQGFITLAENVDGAALTPTELIPEQPKRISLFTGVPLKTPVQGFLSQEFSYPQHPGIDIVASEGTPVKAAADGVVAFSGWTYKAGYMVVLHHADGYLTFYWHNSRNFALTHQLVKQGEVIAFVGNSGETTSGPHLHFEIWKDGYPLNPRQLLIDFKRGD